MSANNSCHLIGRLTKEIELRKTTTGKTFAKFTLAVNRDKDNADFINCVAWNKLAELLYNKFNKGDEFAVEGHLQTRKYDKNGITQFTTELFVESMSFTYGNKHEEGYKPASTAQSYSYQSQPDESELDRYDISDDNLPF